MGQPRVTFGDEPPYQTETAEEKSAENCHIQTLLRHTENATARHTAEGDSEQPDQPRIAVYAPRGKGSVRVDVHGPGSPEHKGPSEAEGCGKQKGPEGTDG